MRFETPATPPKKKAKLPEAPFSAETQAEYETSRTLTSAELLKGGAGFVPGKKGAPELIATEEQKSAANREMGKDFYKRYKYREEELEGKQKEIYKNRQDIQIERVVNGIKIEICKDSINPKFYDIYLPQLSDIDSETLEAAEIYDPYLRFDDNNELAMEVYEYAAELAKTGKDAIAVFKGVEQFIKEKN